MATVHANNAHGHGFITRVGAAMSEFFAAVAEARRMADRYEDPTHLGHGEQELIDPAREDLPKVDLRARH